MSYIPKYILKRMLPKTCLSLDGDMIKIEMVNVISPISVDEVPDDVLNYLAVKVNDTEVADLSGLVLIWGDKEFTLSNIKELVGVTLPVGDKLTIKIPNSVGLKSGDKPTVEVTIKTDNPMNIKVDRVVQ